MRLLSIAAIASLSAVGFVHTAPAADMPAKAPVGAPPPAYNWTGVYIGVHGGGAFGSTVNAISPHIPGSATAFYNFPNATAANGGRYDYSLGNGAIAGGTIGY